MVQQHCSYKAMLHISILVRRKKSHCESFDNIVFGWRMRDETVLLLLRCLLCRVGHAVVVLLQRVVKRLLGHGGGHFGLGGAESVGHALEVSRGGDPGHDTIGLLLGDILRGTHIKIGVQGSGVNEI